MDTGVESTKCEVYGWRIMKGIYKVWSIIFSTQDYIGIYSNLTYSTTTLNHSGALQMNNCLQAAFNDGVVTDLTLPWDQCHLYKVPMSACVCDAFIQWYNSFFNLRQPPEIWAYSGWIKMIFHVLFSGTGIKLQTMNFRTAMKFGKHRGVKSFVFLN